ncbi:DUF3040 domain-containing protein [Dactylosporangium cerinum]|uniref:DUF3040 domain-containing protein n=1 Tax=Dactylosporangium cerinum TaxID=1434730 RepID=A0ABV9WGZ4_9ACTN
MLPGDEQHKLSEIERNLYATDPAFAERFRGFQSHDHTAVPTAGVVLGLALFVIGAASDWWAMALLGVVTFALTVVAVRHARRKH